MMENVIITMDYAIDKLLLSVSDKTKKNAITVLDDIVLIHVFALFLQLFQSTLDQIVEDRLRPPKMLGI